MRKLLLTFVLIAVVAIPITLIILNKAGFNQEQGVVIAIQDPTYDIEKIKQRRFYILQATEMSLDKDFVRDLSAVLNISIDMSFCSQGSLIVCRKNDSSNRFEHVLKFNRMGKIKYYINLLSPEIPLVPGQEPPVIAQIDENKAVDIAVRVLKEVVSVLSRRGFNVSEWSFKPIYKNVSLEYIFADVEKGVVYKIPGRVQVVFNASYAGTPIMEWYYIEISLYSLKPIELELSMFNFRPIKKIDAKNILPVDVAIKKHINMSLIRNMIKKDVKVLNVSHIDVVYNVVNVGDKVYAIPFYKIRFSEINATFYASIVEDEILQEISKKMAEQQQKIEEEIVIDPKNVNRIVIKSRNNNTGKIDVVTIVEPQLIEKVINSLANTIASKIAEGNFNITLSDSEVSTLLIKSDNYILIELRKPIVVKAGIDPVEKILTADIINMVYEFGTGTVSKVDMYTCLKTVRGTWVCALRSLLIYPRGH